MHATYRSRECAALRLLQKNCVVARGMNFELCVEINTNVPDQMHASVLLPPISVLYHIDAIVHLHSNAKNLQKG